jgi:serine palmitoyltransferase
LLETWEPEPLVPALNKKEQYIIDNCPIIEGFTPERDALLVRGVSEPVIDCSTYDFLGMSQAVEVKQASKEALDFYGCGSCGPRGFYGTIDQHLNFEYAIAKVMLVPATLTTE